MRRPCYVAIIVVIVLGSMAMPAVAQAGPTLTYQQIAAMSPEEQAAILDPLRAVASAAGAVGRAQGLAFSPASRSTPQPEP